MSKVILDYGGALDYGVPSGIYYSDPAGEIATLTAKLEAAEDALEQEKYAHSGSSAAKFEAWRKIDEQAAQIESLEKDAAQVRDRIEDAAEEWARYVEVDTAPRTLLEHMRAAILGDSHVR